MNARLDAIEATHAPITTAEVLRALPVGTIVRDGMGDAWQRSDGDDDEWTPANPLYTEADSMCLLGLGGTSNPVHVVSHADYRPIPALVAALRAVLALHRPDVNRGSGEYCAGCETVATFTYYPCATVRAITAALSATEGNDR